MARRRSMKDLLTPDPTPDRQLTHPSGWCITNEHDGCKYQFSHGKCGCWCHTGKPKPTPVVDEEAPKPKRRGRPPKAQPAMEDDPRPWRK